MLDTDEELMEAVRQIKQGIRDAGGKEAYLDILKGQFPADNTERMDKILADVQQMKRDVARILREKEKLAEQLRAARRVIASNTGGQAIDPDLLGDLIRLCHPDRHRGSKLANDTTARLLAMREST